MVSPVLDQQPLTLREASQLIPGNPHYNTLRRWAHKGLNGVRLKSFRSGGRICTTKPAIEEFFAACTGKVERDDAERVSDSHSAAEERLDSLGVK